MIRDDQKEQDSRSVALWERLRAVTRERDALANALVKIRLQGSPFDTQGQDTPVVIATDILERLEKGDLKRKVSNPV